jgi:ABC-2 type transport system ATP-binding protein
VTVVETQSLTKRYGDSVLAVDDLNLTVRPGEVYGFLGPNGAGKSTTINLILNFITPTSGSVSILGHDPRETTTEIRERVGLLPEGVAPYENLTGREHVELAVDCKGADDDPDRILDRVGLAASDARRPAGDYSKGMAQRLGLGMALVGDPDLLVLDEPSSGLDPTGMKEIRELIRTEADDGTAVFFSSHILDEVEAVCDRVGILNEGRLVAQNTVDALREELTGDPTVEIHVDSVPDDDLGLTDHPSVVETDVAGGKISVTCASTEAKADVIAHANEQTAVTDVVSTGRSLEHVFENYTEQSPDAEGSE